MRAFHVGSRRPSGAVSLALDPRAWRDVGWQLSFAAVVGILVQVPAGHVVPATRPHALAASAMLFSGAALAQAVPTTFGTVIGNGLLCRDQTANFYYYDYLLKAFGPAYKHDGGAFWFKTEGANLWGTPVSEVMVSDDTSTYIFVGAVAEATPLPVILYMHGGGWVLGNAETHDRLVAVFSHLPHVLANVLVGQLPGSPGGQLAQGRPRPVHPHRETPARLQARLARRSNRSTSTISKA